MTFTEGLHTATAVLTHSHCRMAMNLNEPLAAWYYSKTDCEGMGMCCEKKTLIG